MEEAYKYLHEMEERRIQLHPFLDADIIEEVFRAVGVKGSSKGGPQGKKGDRAGQSSKNDKICEILCEFDGIHRLR